MLHAERTVETVRWYAEGDSYEKHSPYKAVATLMWLGPITVYIQGLHGEFDKTFRKELEAYLKQAGAKYVFADRHGSMKLYTINQE